MGKKKTTHINTGKLLSFWDEEFLSSKEKEEPPSQQLKKSSIFFWQKFPLYQNFPPEIFFDWRWQTRNMIRTPEHLFHAFPWLTEEKKQ